MNRRLFTILSALSLILCIGSATMWVRSGFSYDRVCKEHGGGRSSTLTSGNGILTLSLASYRPSRPDGLPGPWLLARSSIQAGPNWAWVWPARRTSTTIRHFQTGSASRVCLYVVRDLDLPYWLLTLSAGILPGFWCWRRRKAKCRQKAGSCRNCGYDLRASPQRCPECGTAAPVHSPGPGNTT